MEWVALDCKGEEQIFDSLARRMYQVIGAPSIPLLFSPIHLSRPPSPQASKKASGERGKAHVAKFDEDRAKAIAAKKKANRDSEKVIRSLRPSPCGSL